MSRLRAFVLRLAASVTRDRQDREFAAELESHLALHIDDNVRAGMTPEEARRHALVKLGGIVQVKQLHRERRALPALDALARDVRFGARLLRKTPGFTAVAVLTVALGIGANTLIFSFLNAVLFRPLAVDRPGELVMLNRGGAYPTHSYPDYRNMRDESNAVVDLMAFRFAPMSLETDDRPARIWGYLASGNYFDVLGTDAIVGRTFTPDDDRAPGAHPVVVLSYGCWQRRFGGTEAVVGRVLRINGLPFTVLGVMPPDFRGTELYFTPEAWVPMAMQAEIEPGNAWLDRRQTHNIFVVGRLRPGVTPAEAGASIDGVAAQLAREHPALNEGLRITLSPPGLPSNAFRGTVAGFGGALLGIASLVLLLACTNLTGMLLARATDRQRQTAVCLALGARRSHLVRQSLVESAMLCAAGAAAAVLLTVWLSGMLNEWRAPVDFPLGVTVALDRRVVIFSTALAAVAALLVGLAPALHAAGTNLMAVLKQENPGRGSRWHLRDVVVGAQMTLSVLLLIGSLLVMRSLQQAVHVDVGFNPHKAVSMRVDLGLQGYDEDRGTEFQRLVQQRVSALPGIESASVANSLPLSLDHSTNSVFVEGDPEPRAREVKYASFYQVAPGFFRTMQTRLVAGREFGAHDNRGGAAVAIVNQAFVDLHLAGGNALGRRFRTGRRGQWTEIVGVVQDGRYQALGEARRPVTFYPIAQRYNPTTTIVARVSIAESDALETIRRTVHEIDPGLSIFEDGSLSQLLALPMLPIRVAAGALSAFGLLAVILVTIGTYALVSYSIARRTREICIRLAIGASAGDIVRLVLGRTAWVCAAGGAVGMALGLAAAPLLSPLLLGVRPREPAAFVAAGVVLLVTTAAACWHPTRRALANDPAALLRAE